MYASLKRLNPEEYFERARVLYRMMRRAGYTSVGEFHYVHHQADGREAGTHAQAAENHVGAVELKVALHGTRQHSFSR